MEEYRSGHNESDSKSFDGVSRPWVRIPPPPPFNDWKAVSSCSNELAAFISIVVARLSVISTKVSISLLPTFPKIYT